MLHNYTAVSRRDEIFIGSFNYGKRIIPDTLLKIFLL